MNPIESAFLCVIHHSIQLNNPLFQMPQFMVTHNDNLHQIYEAYMSLYHPTHYYMINSLII